MTYRIAAIPMTLRDLTVMHFLKCDFPYSFAAVDKVSTDL